VTYIIGIDPGPVVGAVLLRLPPPAGRPDAWYAEIAQVTPNCVPSLITGWVEAYNVLAVAAETFVVGPLASRVNDRSASQAARDVLARLRPGNRDGVRYRHWFERRAVEVKPWATDTRLAAAGLLDPTKGMRHARDAARHALFAACRDFGARDPLSKRSVS
jgi:hypothetical protein